MTIQNKGYLTIPGWMRTELQLTGNDLIVFAIIYSACQVDGQDFTGSLQYLADWCGSSKQGILKNIKNLIDRNLIVKMEYGYNKSGYRCSTKLNTDVQHSLTPSCHIYMESSNNGSNKPIQLINNGCMDNKNDKKYKKTDRAVSRDDVDNFVRLYHKHCFNLPKVRQLSDKRINAIKKIIMKYSQEDIIEVFDNANNSDFLLGKCEGTWKADFDFILREDKFLNILEGKYGGHKEQKAADGLKIGKKATKEEIENEYIYKF